jgi:hypothetical protein
MLLWKLLRKVWVQIQDGVPVVDIPEDWLSATLVCLFKNKGSRLDPAKYRGISLISSVEKIVSIILLNRIKDAVEVRLLQGQNGFRALKSCRDAVFQLWRAIEKANNGNEAYILTFIDYSKAFDSLDWERLWKMLEFAGCPVPLIKVMSTMYNNSTIAIRLSSDGKLAPEFKQKKGIRQGSSLSPCLFILAMDFCLRVFQSSCVEKGLPSHDDTWFAYADDMADKSLSEDEASEALQQLEAASAFVGLRLNVPKTEVMAKGITKVVATSSSAPVKELVEVQYTNGWFRGWKAETKDAELLQVKRSPEKKGSNIVIKFIDDEDVLFAEERGGGWLRDEDGDAHRIRKLGRITPLKGHSITCDACGACFGNAKGLKVHTGGRSKWCRNTEHMTSKELRRLHRTNRTYLTRRGKAPDKVELVTVKTCEGKATKPCGSFLYLGTLTSPDASSTPETRRRIGIALGNFGALHKVWKDKAISRITKSRLYKALILTVMLYNAEIWRLVEHDIQALEGAHFRMMRSMRTVSGSKDNYSREQLSEDFHLHDIFDYIRQKRLRWIGHALRRRDNDRSKIAVLEALKDKTSPWTKLVHQDCCALGTTLNVLPKLVQNRAKFRNASHVCTLRRCGQKH